MVGARAALTGQRDKDHSHGRLGRWMPKPCPPLPRVHSPPELPGARIPELRLRDDWCKPAYGHLGRVKCVEQLVRSVGHGVLQGEELDERQVWTALPLMGFGGHHRAVSGGILLARSCEKMYAGQTSWHPSSLGWLSAYCPVAWLPC